MQRAHLLLPIALLLTPSTGSRDELVWKPAEGTLVRTFETVSESELDEMAMILDGEEQENPRADSIEVTMRTVETMVLVDEVLEVDDERATHFERTFRELSQERTMESSMMPEGQEGERISDLEEKTVVFKWDDDEEEYELEFETDEGLDDELLQGLREDASLRGFLPEDEVEEGDSWEVEIEAYVHAMWPGGNVSFYVEEEGPSEFYAEMTGALHENVEGSIEATFEGIREEDGVRVAVITVEIEAATEAEVEVEDERMGEVVQAVSLRREVEGEILWNLESQRLFSFVGEAQGEETNEMRASMQGPDGVDHDFARRSTYAGTTKYNFTLEEE